MYIFQSELAIVVNVVMAADGREHKCQDLSLVPRVRMLEPQRLSACHLRLQTYLMSIEHAAATVCGNYCIA